MTNKLTKKKIFYLVIILLVILVLIIIFSLTKIIKKPEIEKEVLPKEKTLEETFKGLSGPEGVEIQPLPAEVIEDLTAPKKEKSVLYQKK